MKATKFTLAASVAFATMLAAGATASADVTTKAQNGEMGSIPALAPDSPAEFEAPLSPRMSYPAEPHTFYRDTEGKDIASPIKGIHGNDGVKIGSGYVFVKAEVDANGNLINIYTSQTTINFSAQFNDDRPDAHFTWTFPANTEVTYARLFELAGLNPNDFDLSDQDWAGQLGNNSID